jgi:hypothetical protein
MVGIKHKYCTKCFGNQDILFMGANGLVLHCKNIVSYTELQRSHYVSKLAYNTLLSRVEPYSIEYFISNLHMNQWITL